MHNKTSKTFSTRIKVKKSGKLIRRKMGLSHFKSKKNANTIRGLRNDINISRVDAKVLKAHL